MLQIIEMVKQQSYTLIQVVKINEFTWGFCVRVCHGKRNFLSSETSQTKLAHSFRNESQFYTCFQLQSFYMVYFI